MAKGSSQLEPDFDSVLYSAPPISAGIRWNPPESATPSPMVKSQTAEATAQGLSTSNKCYLSSYGHCGNISALQWYDSGFKLEGAPTN